MVEANPIDPEQQVVQEGPAAEMNGETVEPAEEEKVVDV